MSLVECLLSYDERDDVEIYFSKDTPVDSNRNKIVSYFLEETDHERLVMIDDDIIPPDDVLSLFDGDEDIISPIVFSKRNGIPYPAIYDLDECGQTKVAFVDGSGYQNVDAVGTGCIGIKRRVFESLDEPYFSFKTSDDGTVNTGEDISFCLDAREAGFDIVVSLDHVAGHMVTSNLKAYLENMNHALEEEKSDLDHGVAGE